MYSAESRVGRQGGGIPSYAQAEQDPARSTHGGPRPMRASRRGRPSAGRVQWLRMRAQGWRGGAWRSGLTDCTPATTDIYSSTHGIDKHVIEQIAWCGVARGYSRGSAETLGQAGTPMGRRRSAEEAPVPRAAPPSRPILPLPADLPPRPTIAHAIRQQGALAFGSRTSGATLPPTHRHAPNSPPIARADTHLAPHAPRPRGRRCTA
jgi:hypothetical protein